MWGFPCHSFALQINKRKSLLKGNIENVFYLLCFGGGRESKSGTKNLEFSLSVSSEIINESTVTETVCSKLNRQKHNSSPTSPFFFSLHVTVLVMQCLDFLEEVMESGIYSVGLKMAICVSYILLCENPVLSEYVKIIELFTKKENLSMNITTLSCHQRGNIIWIYPFYLHHLIVIWVPSAIISPHNAK